MSKLPNSEDIKNMSLQALRDLLQRFEPDDSFLAALESDSRAGAKALARSIRNSLLREARLHEKMQTMLAMEQSFAGEGYAGIAGVDEAGRGPLAGPVFAAAVILPNNTDSLLGLDDSKTLTAAKRDYFYDIITSCAVSWGVGFADNTEIDEVGILQATMNAMARALKQLDPPPSLIIVDGNRVPNAGRCEERAIVDGDAQSLSIAAASVIAKVSRDRLMIELDAVYPHYGFAQHKGYGSEQHLAALRKHGPCPLHRFSFKIVPESAPEGTVVKVLGSRLENAPSIEVLERAGTAIGRIKDTITTHDLADLRGIYRNRLEAFNHNSISVGRSGEHAACEYLQGTKGFTIVSRNWRAPCGYEIDIIAQSSDCLVFCEVKTAKTSRYGDPATWVTEEKSNRIAKAAEEYIACNDIGGCRLRFDVLALKEQFGEYEVNHIENAFSIDDSFFEEENGR